MLLSSIREQYKITPEIVAKPDIVTRVNNIFTKSVVKKSSKKIGMNTTVKPILHVELKSRITTNATNHSEDYQFEAESKTTSYQSVSE